MPSPKKFPPKMTLTDVCHPLITFHKSLWRTKKLSKFKLKAPFETDFSIAIAIKSLKNKIKSLIYECWLIDIFGLNSYQDSHHSQGVSNWHTNFTSS